MMLRIYLNGERMSIGSTGIMVNPKGWSKAKNQMAGRSTETLSINLRLSNIQQRVYKIFEKLDGTNELSLARIKSEYNGNQKDIKTVSQFFEKYSSDIKSQEGKEICHATYLWYERCMRRFIDMLVHTYKKRDLYIAEVNPMVIHNFQVYLTANAPLAHNAVVKMMKTLKTIFIFAQRMVVMGNDPFQDMRFHTTPTDRGFLTDDEVSAILAKEVPVKRLELLRDLFVFSCFTGLAYVDLANLQSSDIITINEQKWIKSKRAKTSVPINVMLLDIPLKLIEKYAADRHVANTWVLLDAQRCGEHRMVDGYLFHFPDTRIAVLRLPNAYHDAEDFEIVIFGLSFQSIPADMPDMEATNADGILAQSILLVVWILGKAFCKLFRN